MPAVSIIIPSYNSTRTLALCLRSALDQSVKPLDIIVVDDCSTDDSHRVAEAMGARVFRTAVNSGQCAARNLGARHARGDILFFLDADIALGLDSVEAAVALLDGEPGLDAISGVLDLQPLLSNRPAAHYRALQMHHFWLKHENEHSGPHVCMFAIRKAAFRDIGPFNESLRHTEPAEYRARLTRRHTMRVSPAIHGRHDHQEALRELLPKVFTRARVSLQEGRHGGELGGTTSRVYASAAVLGAILTLPLTVLLGPAWALAPLLLLTAALALDAGTYRQIFASRGFLFGCYFVGAHVVFQTTAAAGAVIGVLQRALASRPSFSAGAR